MNHIARLSTCKHCGIKLQSHEKFTYSNKTYCKECYDKKIQEKSSYDELLKIIGSYYNLNNITGLIFKQIKDYKEQFEYSYSGMIYTLWYVKEIEKKSFNEIKYGIAYIKYYYDKAKEYYEQQNKISQSISSSPVENTRKITVKINNSNKNNNWLFDINSLYKEGE